MEVAEEAWVRASVEELGPSEELEALVTLVPLVALVASLGKPRK